MIPSVLFNFFKARHDGIFTLMFFPRTLTVVELLTLTNYIVQPRSNKKYQSISYDKI